MSEWNWPMIAGYALLLLGYGALWYAIRLLVETLKESNEMMREMGREMDRLIAALDEEPRK